jgi:hypothetical protein
MPRGHNPVAIKTLLVDLFVEAHERAPRQIILDLDATDDPLHGEQEGRFFHGYYDCYGYLPLYVFCGRHLLVAKLRRASLDAADGAVEEVARVVARIRARWPTTRIMLRADSGFAREDPMAWCEANGVDFLFGLAKNERLIAEIKTELDVVAAKSRRTGRMERCFKSFMWMTRRTWSRRRRIVAKAVEGFPPLALALLFPSRFVTARLDDRIASMRWEVRGLWYNQKSPKHCEKAYEAFDAMVRSDPAWLGDGKEPKRLRRYELPRMVGKRAE